MPTSDRVLPVLIDDDVWRDEVERFAEKSTARTAAEHDRRRLAQAGIRFDDLLACLADGPDGTRLAGARKLYVPVGDGPPSARPYAFIFRLVRDKDRLALRFLAYGERHPRNPSTRSVYQRAHKRLHGRYPDQERDR